MNDTLIVTVYVVLDDLLRAMGHRTDCRARTGDSEVLTLGVIAACQFANHHERALCVLRAMGYLAGPLSISRFNRRFHALAHRLSDARDLLAALLTEGTIFIIDSVPLPVCRRARARRCCKVRRAEYCGYCAAKVEKFFGWRLHLVVTAQGIPVSFDLLPASCHDLTLVNELMERLRAGRRSTRTRGTTAPRMRHGSRGRPGFAWCHDDAITWRRTRWGRCTGCGAIGGRIETVNSQLEAWGAQRLHARTHEGWLCKVLASLFALLYVNRAVAKSGCGK